MKCYKGFDKDLKCRGFQYEIGKSYTEEKADICSKGFHACEYPLDVFNYYPPSESRFCEVELDANDQVSDDTKRVGKHIEIKEEIGIAGLVKASVEYIKKHCENNKERTVDYSAATNTGDRSAATNTGYYSAATVSGKESIAFASGYESKAKGSIGCFIVLSDWRCVDDEYHIVDVKSAKVDGEKIKADTFYTLKDGEFLEVEE